ncbi:Uncharacterized protein FKW44_010932 [Caligus rogercresseyi]|uniref:Uncharacterized protein n=1 Tax=Caligus rogercresseyi TaxID=217165 RepID=A0A7T8HHE4_CALRO|nr:Uncharacterized protein FKW44_010932 [Caligus rogercresseyi]
MDPFQLPMSPNQIPYFLFHLDNWAREEHWVRKEWPERTHMTVEEKNVIFEPLVERSKIIFPLLHIKD